MARAIILGNGNSLVCLDQSGQVRDFYFPFAGQENHIGQNQVHKVGVFVDGNLSWIDNGDWQVDTKYEEYSMVSQTSLINNKLKLKLNFCDIVYNEKNVFVRKITIRNENQTKKNIKIFLNQQFKIGDTNHADTAYYSGAIQSIIHYKGRRVFLVGGMDSDNKSFDDYGVGFCGIEGKEGTWMDAEDGLLSKNPIEHGIVDSVISWQKEVEPNQEVILYQWILVGETYREVCELLKYIQDKSPEHLIETTRDFWYAWANQVDVNLDCYSEEIKKLFYDSLFVMRASTDNRGGILASADSGNVQYGGDTYVYVWPRDASFVAWTFDIINFFDLSKRFYEFAREVLTEDGYILHKYQPDYSLGSSWHPWVKDGKKQLAIQEDETAILLVGLWEHYIRAKDLEFVESLYNNFIKRAALFMIKHRDNETGLPLPSYDLWEEKYGVSTFTSSVVYGALVSAGNFAKTLGKEEDMENYYKEADSIKKSIIKYLWDESEERFVNLINNPLVKDPNLDISGFYGVFRFGVLSPDDERMRKALVHIEKKLSQGVNVGGFARYENDNYARIDHGYAGNPWFVTTLWITQYKIANAKTIQDLEECIKDINWAKKYAKNSVMPEQLNPFNGEGISATPLTWSHSEFVRTIIEYSKKLEILKNTQNK